MSIPGRQENDFWKEFEQMFGRMKFGPIGEKWNAESIPEADRKRTDKEKKKVKKCL